MKKLMGGVEGPEITERNWENNFKKLCEVGIQAKQTCFPFNEKTAES